MNMIAKNKAEIETVGKRLREIFLDTFSATRWP
jgi:hypothetical protein